MREGGRKGEGERERVTKTSEDKFAFCSVCWAASSYSRRKLYTG